MNKKQIINERRKGDIKLVAEILDVNYENARKILNRPKSKLHKKAVDVLEKIIKNRKQLLEEIK
jgi:hypothetical protein